MILSIFLTFGANSDLIQTRFWEKVRIQTKPEKSDQFGHTENATFWSQVEQKFGGVLDKK